MKLKDQARRGCESLAMASGEDASPWVRLANGVILQAVNEYRLALSTIIEKERWLESEEAETSGEKKRAMAERKVVESWKSVEEIEDFFGSNRCKIFTELDMTIISKKIRAEYPEAKTVRKKPWRCD